MRKIAINVIASVLLLVGLVSMFTPIPGGLFLIAFSLTVLICTSTRAARLVVHLRSQVRILNNAMTWLEDRMGERVGEALRRTRPPSE